jgi:hypothetical protein
MTELGDAGLEEAEIMAHSTHKSARAAGIYVKKTEKQRQHGAMKRRKYLDAGTKGG